MDRSQKKRARVGGAFMLSALLTGIYYLLVFQGPLAGGTLERYTTAHISEWVNVLLFFWASTELVLIAWRLRVEKASLKHEWLPAKTGPAPIAHADELNALLDAAPERLQSTRLGRRLRDAVTYVREKRSADGFDDELDRLSEVEGERSHAQFAVARFVVGSPGTELEFAL